VEKRREREEFGRDTGFLSEYVAFIDVWLGRNDVAASEMRLSFPYFVGPATWSFFHTSAEIVEAMSDVARIGAIDAFEDFFRSLATMYPCPYCRFHLNRYVVRNREVDLYPLEYLLLGRKEDEKDLVVALDDKLGAISALCPLQSPERSPGFTAIPSRFIRRGSGLVSSPNWPMPSARARWIATGLRSCTG